MGLIDWLSSNRSAGTSYGALSVRLYELTGDMVSHETLRRWSKGERQAA